MNHKHDDFCEVLGELPSYHKQAKLILWCRLCGATVVEREGRKNPTPNTHWTLPDERATPNKPRNAG